MHLIVQKINVSWTKQSRGGKASTKRNAVKEAFPILEIPKTAHAATVLYDRLRFTEYEDFQQPRPRSEVAQLHFHAALRYECLTLEPAPE